MAIVTLSRQLGAGGSEIACGVARALGLRILDRETINSAAREAGVPEVALRELDYEGRRGLVQRVLDALKASPAIPDLQEVPSTDDLTPLNMPRGILTPARPLLSAAMEDYVRIVGMVITNMVKEGNILVVGRGSQVVLRDVPGAFHVQIVAPMAVRVEKQMRLLNVTRQLARQRVAASDQARADYLHRYFGVNWLDPQLYDLVINTSRISIQTAIQLVVLAQLQRSLPGMPAAGS